MTFYKPARRVGAGPFGYTEQNLAGRTPEEHDEFERELGALENTLQWGFEPERFAKGAAWHAEDWPEAKLVGGGELAGLYDRRDDLIAEAGDFREVFGKAKKISKREAGLASPLLPALASLPKSEQDRVRNQTAKVRELIAFGETPDRWESGIGYPRDDGHLLDPEADTERLSNLWPIRDSLTPVLDQTDHALDLLREADEDSAADPADTQAARDALAAVGLPAGQPPAGAAPGGFANAALTAAAGAASSAPAAPPVGEAALRQYRQPFTPPTPAGAEVSPAVAATPSHGPARPPTVRGGDDTRPGILGQDTDAEYTTLTTRIGEAELRLAEETVRTDAEVAALRGEGVSEPEIVRVAGPAREMAKAMAKSLADQRVRASKLTPLGPKSVVSGPTGNDQRAGLEARVTAALGLTDEAFRDLQLDIARASLPISEKVRLQNAAINVRNGKIAPEYVFSEEPIARPRESAGRIVAAAGSAVANLFEGPYGIPREDLGPLVSRTPEEFREPVGGLIRAFNEVLIVGGSQIGDLALRALAAPVVGGIEAVVQTATELGMSRTDARRLRRDLYMGAEISAAAVGSGPLAARPRPGRRGRKGDAERTGSLVDQAESADTLDTMLAKFPPEQRESILAQVRQAYDEGQQAARSQVEKRGLGKSTKVDPSQSVGIKLFVDESLKKNKDRTMSFDLGEISDAEALRLKLDTGLNLQGYKRVIDSAAIRHTIKQHGNPKLEAKRGQVAITEADFVLIPEIIASPDRITYSGKNNIGRDVIVYEKRFNGVTFYIEEVRTGKKVAALQTMYKRPLK